MSTPSTHILVSKYLFSTKGNQNSLKKMTDFRAGAGMNLEKS